MSTTANRNKVGLAQENRAIALSKEGRTGQNGSTETGKTHATKRGLRIHLLVSKLKSVTSFEMLLKSRQYRNKGESDLLSIIDTEEKQLKAIADLYSIVKVQPKYKNLKEKWDENTEPSEILAWLLRKLGPLAKGNEWTIDKYMDGKKSRFCFIVYKPYNTYKINREEQYMPLDFLPSLLKRDRALHDMIIDLVALISKSNKIPLWDEDGDYSFFLNNIQKCQGMEAHKVCYLQGAAHDYLTLIKQRKEVVTVESLKKMLNGYEINSQRKRYLAWWIKEGISLASTKQDIKRFSFIPEHVTGNPITPFRTYKFVFSIHKNDILDIGVTMKFRKDQKDGWFLPVQYSVTKPGCIIEPIVESAFPEELHQFMKSGLGIVTRTHREYFYKNTFDLSIPPAINIPEEGLKLLHELELTELKKKTS